MQSKDLRVGNYVWNDLPFGGREIHEIKVYDFGCQIMKDAEPIEINEEWLSGFELKNGKFGKYWIIKSKHQNSHYRIWFYENKLTFSHYNEPRQFPENLCQIQYIHELQNLYFALTGEELELKSESKP